MNVAGRDDERHNALIEAGQPGPPRAMGSDRP